MDGVSGATADPLAQGYATPIDVSHTDPSKQALIDFRDSVVNNKKPESNVYSGANTAVCVQFSLDAMIEEKIINCKPSNFYNSSI